MPSSDPPYRNVSFSGTGDVLSLTFDSEFGDSLFMNGTESESKVRERTSPVLKKLTLR